MKEYLDPSQKVPIRSWASRIDRASMMQLTALARSDRLAGPVAVMPDVHMANEVCVGTVLAAKDCVFPTAIEMDLGCGMCAQSYPLDLGQFCRGDLERIHNELMRDIPTGRRVHSQPQEMSEALRGRQLSTKALEHVKLWLGSRHLGTLGGGNHFIEIQHDPSGKLWAAVHSGSRGIGGAIYAHHAKIAAGIPQTDVLPCFHLNTELADAFFNDLDWAIRFGAENRKRMLDAVTMHLETFVGAKLEPAGFFDAGHNLISVESHPCWSSAPLVVHRKGAMPAGAGTRGIIPGSMGTASYLVEGLGEGASFQSCSHGAGRKMSRAEAHKNILLKDFQRQMSHVIYPHGQRMDRALIEEAPGAYKDIKEVLALQSELVRPLLRLMPVAVVKGVD